MNKITFPLEPQMRGPEIDNLQAALQLLLDRRAILANDEAARLDLADALQKERTETFYGDATSRGVGICLAVEEVYHYGDIWREKRDACERIKVEGFRFFQLTGRYGESAAYKALTGCKPVWSHRDVYRDFANRVEGIIESEIGSYINMVGEDTYADLTQRSNTQVTEAVAGRFQPDNTTSV